MAVQGHFVVRRFLVSLRSCLREKKILPHAERMELRGENKEPESAKAPAQHWQRQERIFKENSPNEGQNMEVSDQLCCVFTSK